MKLRLLALALLVAAVGLMLAPVATSKTEATKATTVTVTLGKPSEFKITLSKKTIKSGVTTFKVTNKGRLPHDFKISGKKTKRLAAGKSATLKVTLSKGSKPYLCTVAGHAAAGMKGTLKVT